MTHSSFFSCAPSLKTKYGLESRPTSHLAIKLQVVGGGEAPCKILKMTINFQRRIYVPFGYPFHPNIFLTPVLQQHVSTAHNLAKHPFHRVSSARKPFRKRFVLRRLSAANLSIFILQRTLFRLI